MHAPNQSNQLAQTMMAAMNALAGLAAPRVLASIPRSGPFVDHVRAHLHRLKALFGPETLLRGPGLQPEVILQEVDKMLPQLALWDPLQQPPAELVTSARRCLVAMGLPEPKEGWDQLEPPSDD